VAATGQELFTKSRTSAGGGSEQFWTADARPSDRRSAHY
jgi:hypothetical protein